MASQDADDLVTSSDPLHVGFSLTQILTLSSPFGPAGQSHPRTLSILLSGLSWSSGISFHTFKESVARMGYRNGRRHLHSDWVRLSVDIGTLSLTLLQRQGLHRTIWGAKGAHRANPYLCTALPTGGSIPTH